MAKEEVSKSPAMEAANLMQGMAAMGPLIAEAKKSAAKFEGEVSEAFKRVLDNQVKMWAKLQAIEAKIDART